MFNIDSEPTVRAAVKVKLPGQADQEFFATFRVLDVDTFNGFDLSDADSCRAFLETAVSDLDDIVDAAGKPVSFSPVLLSRMVNSPIVRSALVRAYVEEVGQACLGN